MRSFLLTSKRAQHSLFAEHSHSKHVMMMGHHLIKLEFAPFPLLHSTMSDYESRPLTGGGDLYSKRVESGSTMQTLELVRKTIKTTRPKML